METMNVGTLNEVLLRRKNSIITESGDTIPDHLTDELEECKVLVCETYLKNGLVPSTRVIAMYLNIFKTLGSQYDFAFEVLDRITTIVTRDVNLIRRVLGINRTYTQLYKNIEVARRVNGTAYDFVVQVLHYMSLGTWKPTDDGKDLHEEFNIDTDDLILIGGLDVNDIKSLLCSLVSSKTSVREQDYEDINKIICYLMGVSGVPINEIVKMIADNCVFKEILATIFANLISDGLLGEDLNIYAEGILPHNNLFRNYKDILRLVVALQGGNPALCEHPLVARKDMDYKVRDFIMRLMNNVSLNTINQTRHDREAWIVIGDIIHPYSFIPKNVKLTPKYRIDEHIHTLESEVPQYANAIIAWICIREKVKYPNNPESFEQLMEAGEIEKAVEMVANQPGLFCRKIDYLLRESKSHGQRWQVMERFIEAIDNGNVPVSTLLTIYKHFETRARGTGKRIFSIKSNVVKLYARDEYRKPVSENICSILCRSLPGIIYKKITEKEDIGKVYINKKAFEGMVVPKSLRNQSSGRLIPRGSRFTIPKEIKYLVPYIWWTNTEDGERVDLDLSAVYYNADFSKVELQSYSHKKLSSFHADAVHSGDITNGGDYDDSGVSESIAINLDQLDDVKYIAFTVHSFLNIPFTEQDHSHAGYAMYTESDYNRRCTASEFVHRNNIQKEVNLSTKSTDSIIAIYDVDARQLIWADQPGDLRKINYTNINRTKDSTFLRMMKLLQDSEIRLLSLILMNVNGRNGQFVETKEEADIIFDELSGDEELDKKTITPWSSEYFTSELM